MNTNDEFTTREIMRLQEDIPQIAREIWPLIPPRKAEDTMSLKLRWVQFGPIKLPAWSIVTDLMRVDVNFMQVYHPPFTTRWNDYGSECHRVKKLIVNRKGKVWIALYDSPEVPLEEIRDWVLLSSTLRSLKSLKERLLEE